MSAYTEFITLSREDYDSLVSDRERLEVVKELISKTSYVSRCDLLVVLGAEDKCLRKEREE